jgi:hypothetical protein
MFVQRADQFVIALAFLPAISLLRSARGAVPTLVIIAAERNFQVRWPRARIPLWGRPSRRGRFT